MVYKYPVLQVFEVQTQTKEPTFSYHLTEAEAVEAATRSAFAASERPLEIVVAPVKLVFFPTFELPSATRLYAGFCLNAVGFFAADTGDDKIVLGYLKDGPGDYYSLVYKTNADESNPNRFSSEAIEPLLKRLLEEDKSDNT